VAGVPLPDPVHRRHGHRRRVRRHQLRDRRARPRPLPRPGRPAGERTYWFGAIIGTLGTHVFLNLLEPSLGWRLGFAIGPVLGLVIIYVRRHLPESPRWQVMHGQTREAEQTIGHIEEQVRQSGRDLPPVDESKAIEVKAGDDHGWVALARILFRTYPTRSILGASMMITQSFLYNAIFFTYTLVLARFYGVPSTDTPIYFIAFAAGNFLGPLLLGPLFDTWGRKQMISLTYITSGVLLAITAVLFNAGLLTAVTQTLAWSVIFFFASAGASSAYLTVSEIFPMEVRAKAIALFFAIAQCFGALGPVIYGALIGNGEDPTRLIWGYLPGGAVMVLGGIVALVYGVAAERRSLEDIATPLNAVVPASRSGSAPAEGGGSPRSF
jgi:MFS family permease